MCLVVSGVFSYLAYSFYIDEDFANAIINGFVAIFFLGLLVRNIFKTRKEKNFS